jgi:hypothetical protein
MMAATKHPGAMMAWVFLALDQSSFINDISGDVNS